MNEKIYDLSHELNCALINDKRVQLLNELETELNNSSEVYFLSQCKDECANRYSQLKDVYDDDHPIVKEALIDLVTAKKNLNNHPLVKKYLSTYSEVRDLYLEIYTILFSDFKKGD